jgi:hypothetical protein
MFHQLFREKFCLLAFFAGIHAARREINITVAVTSKKSVRIIFTG